jgi:hypothetical protein
MHLFKEHLGLLPESGCHQGSDYGESKYSALEADNLVMDPLDESFYHHVWYQTADKNTHIYRDVFHCVPDDSGK